LKFSVKSLFLINSDMFVSLLITSSILICFKDFLTSSGESIPASFSLSLLYFYFSKVNLEKEELRFFELFIFCDLSNDLESFSFRQIEKDELFDLLFLLNLSLLKFVSFIFLVRLRRLFLTF